MKNVIENEIGGKEMLIYYSFEFKNLIRNEIELNCPKLESRLTYKIQKILFLSFQLPLLQRRR